MIADMVSSDIPAPRLTADPAPQGPRSRGIERLTDLPVALAVQAAGWVLSRLGPRASYRFAGLLAEAWWRLVPSRRRIALRNLEIAYRGALAPAEMERIARESFFHAMATAAGTFLQERWVDGGDRPGVVSADAAVEGILTQPHPRGICILCGHLGDWEMIHYWFALQGLGGLAVVRRIHNPHLDRLVTRLRSCHGGSVTNKDGALRVLRQTLRDGKVIGLLADQSAPPSEGFRRFFGASAATHQRYGRFLVRSGCEIHLVVCIRQAESFRFLLKARDLTGAIRGPGTEAERAERLVAAYLEALEAFIREHPGQYLWMHRRWKIRPPGAPDLYRDLDRPLDPAILEGEADRA